MSSIVVQAQQEERSCDKKYSLDNSIIIDIPLREASGLAIDSRNNLLYLHEDSNNKNNIYVLDNSGKLKNLINLKGFKNNDWEDITTDNKGRFWIINSRVSLLEFQANINGELIDGSIIEYDLPDQLKRKNVESIDYIAKEERIIAIYKGGGNHIYKFKPGDKKAEYIGRISKKLKMQPSGITHHPVSGNYFVVSFWGHKIVELSDNFKNIICIYSLPKGKMLSFQAEGIAFDKDLNLLITCEKPWYSIKGKSSIIKFLKDKKD